MRFSELTPDYTFPRAALAIDSEKVLSYLAATEDNNAVYWQGNCLTLVPPLGLAALAFQSIAQGIALEPGSLHTGQELTFRHPLAVSERAALRARVVASSKRRGFTALVLETAVINGSEVEALFGRMTLLIASGEDGPAAVPPEVPARSITLATVPPVTYPPLAPEYMTAGTLLPSVTRTVTQEHIDAYAMASGDFNPIHINQEFAAHSPFGHTVAHGMLLLAYISVMLTRAFGRTWIESGTLKVRFRNPVPAGTTVTTRGQIERVEEVDGVQYAVCAVALTNEAGNELITGEARVEINILMKRG